ncbi:MAG: hypothetical protein GVY33_03025 [Alphaproteobacteria bacterium]|jgi:hypothetical protein|nr:hypothetical protein [Alphaproteobacteria bacterium]
MQNLTDGLLVEITLRGGWRRVAVLDPTTGAEAVVHGPVDARDTDLVQLARRRLERSAGSSPRRPSGGERA